MTPVINQIKDPLSTLQAMVNAQTETIAQLIQDSKTTITMASTLPSQIESVNSRVDSSISTASSTYLAKMDNFTKHIQSQISKMHQDYLESAKNCKHGTT